MTFAEIQDALYELSPEERAQLKLTIERLAEEDAWDRQIEEDITAGRLDFLSKELDDAIASGDTHDAP